MFNFAIDNDYISTEIFPKLGNKNKDPKSNNIPNNHGLD